jgi:hypothetical protein
MATRPQSCRRVLRERACREEQSCRHSTAQARSRSRESELAHAHDCAAEQQWEEAKVKCGGGDTRRGAGTLDAARRTVGRDGHVHGWAFSPRLAPYHELMSAPAAPGST